MEHRESTRRGRARGVTLIELVSATTIVAIMTLVAVPAVRTTVRKQKEMELRRALRTFRLAIDDYRRMVGENPQYRAAIKKTNAEDYPPDIETLVKGFDTGELKERKLKFLRRMPLDPMTGKADWIVRSSIQERETEFWDHSHVFDVRSRSQSLGLDGTRYADW